jgi:hypothetical protein
MGQVPVEQVDAGIVPVMYRCPDTHEPGNPHWAVTASVGCGVRLLVQATAKIVC